MAEAVTESAKADTNTIEFARLHHNARVIERIIDGATAVLSILSFSVPLYIVYLTVAVLAGKNTVVSAPVAYLAAAMVGGSSISGCSCRRMGEIQGAA